MERRHLQELFAGEGKVMLHLRQEGQWRAAMTHTRCGMHVPFSESTGETHMSTCPHCAEIEIARCQKAIGEYRQRIEMLEEIRDKGLK